MSAEETLERPECVVVGCGRDDVERFRFVPRDIPDYENWPAYWVCEEHRREWHARVTLWRLGQGEGSGSV